MSDDRIASLLAEAFGSGQAPGLAAARPNHRLVFWNDAEAAYAEQITALVPTPRALAIRKAAFCLPQLF